MAYSMLVVRGPEGTEEINLGNHRVTIGRSSENDLVLRDPKASRQHAVLEVTAAGWRVTDLDSGNGIEVNGDDVHDRILGNGDVIKIGATTITLKIVSDPPSPSLPAQRPFDGYGGQSSPAAAAPPPPPPPPPPPKPVAPPAPVDRDTQVDTDRVPRVRRRRFGGAPAAGGGLAIAVVVVLAVVFLIVASNNRGSAPAPRQDKRDLVRGGREVADEVDETGRTAKPKRERKPNDPSTAEPEPEVVRDTTPAQPDRPAPAPVEPGRRDPVADPKPEPAKEPPKTPLGRLTALLLDAVQKKTIQAPYVPLGKENWQVCGGTFETAKLARQGRFEEARWDSIVPEGLFKAFKALGTKPDVRLARAEFALEHGLVEEGFDELAALHREKPEHKPEIDAILARAFGESVPPDGYVNVKGEWMSEAEHKSAVAREKVHELIDEIAALPQVAEAKRTIKKDLRALQRKTVAFIQSDAYTYTTQKDLDQMVGQVRDIWEKPYEYLKRTYPEWNVPFRTTLDTLIGRRIGPDAPLEQAEVESAVTRMFEIKDWAMDGADESTIKINRRVMDQNRRLWSVANPDEMDLLNRINEYRRMIGLTVGALDELLLLADRHHSMEMLRLGYFAHQSPVPKRGSPADRAGEEGAGGGSENIAMSGSVPGAFDGWYNSPPHHRNMISGDVLGPGGRDGMATLQVGGSPSARKDNLMPAWLVDSRMHAIGSGETAKGTSVRRQYMRARLVVLRWLTTSERPESIKELRGSARAFQSFIVKDLKGAAGPWLGVLLDIAGELKAREAIDVALAALDNPDPWVRFVAAEALGKFAGMSEAAAPTSGSTTAQGAALAEPLAKRLARRLVEQLTRESHEAVCAAVMGALADIGWSEGLAALKQVRANAGSWRFRYWAVKAIARSKEIAKEQLALALNDERRAVRELAVVHLSLFEGNPTFDRLVTESPGKPGEYLLVFYARDPQWETVARALGGADGEVRLHAAVASGRLGRRELWQPLLAVASGDKIHDARYFALRSMKQIDDAAARPLIAEAAQRETDKARKSRLEELLR